MDRAPIFSNQLTIREHTVSLYGKRCDDKDGYNPLGLLAEFDCDLTIIYWDEDGGGWNWQVEEVSLYWRADNDRVRVTRDSDACLWAVLARHFGQSKTLQERILERIEEMEEV